MSVRLAYLISRFPSVSHTFVLREIEQLQARGFDIHAASINRPDQSVEQLLDNEKQAQQATYYVKQHGVIGAVLAQLYGLTHPLAYLRCLWFAIKLSGGHPLQLLYNLCYFVEALMLARWMQQQQLHHLHVHFATAAANVALILKQFTPIGLSLTIHGPDEFYDVRGQWLPQKIAAADFVICIGQFARSQLMLITPPEQWHKLEICRLGIDPELYQPAVLKLPHRFTILCVGRLTAAKGQHVLIDACQQLIKQGLDLQLILVGNGPDEASLQQHVSAIGLQDRVRFTGPRNQQQVRQLYQQADVFALASFAEGIPVVLMEAMASGVPCVSTRITGIPELIRDGKDGLLVPASDSQALAQALSRLYCNPALRQHLSRQGRLRVQQHYNLQQNSQQLGQIFQQHLQLEV